MRGDAGFPVRIRFAKRGQGAVHLAPRRRPGVRAGVPHRAAPARVHAGLLAPAEGELRARAVGRPRERRRVPRRRAAPSPSTPTRSAGRLTGALPEGIDVTGVGAARRPGARAAGSRSPSSSTGSRVDRSPTAVAVDGAGRRRSLARDELLDRRSTRKGKRDRRRHPARACAHVEVGRRRRRPALELELATRPPHPRGCADVVTGALRPCSTASRRSSSTGSCAPHNGSSATARGWSRWTPTSARRAPRSARALEACA